MRRIRGITKGGLDTPSQPTNEASSVHLMGLAFANEEDDEGGDDAEDAADDDVSFEDVDEVGEPKGAAAGDDSQQRVGRNARSSRR